MQPQWAPGALTAAPYRPAWWDIKARTVRLGQWQGEGDSAALVTRSLVRQQGTFWQMGACILWHRAVSHGWCWKQHRVMTPGPIWGGVAEENRERLSHCSSDGLFWFRAAQMFPLPVHGSLWTAAAQGLAYGKLESHVHWEWGTQLVLVTFPASESVSWDGMDNADCYWSFSNDFQGFNEKIVNYVRTVWPLLKASEHKSPCLSVLAFRNVCLMFMLQGAYCYRHLNANGYLRACKGLVPISNSSIYLNNLLAQFSLSRKERNWENSLLQLTVFLASLQ